MPVISVTVYPSSIAEHVSQIYTGLIDLHLDKKIRLDFSDKLSVILPSLHEHLLFAEIRTGSTDNSTLVCFDMRDGGKTISEDTVAVSDVYFKRSFDTGYVQQLPETLSKKIYPYGLNYACRSRHLRKALKQQIFYHAINQRLTGNPLSSAMHIGGHLTSLFLSSRLWFKTGSLRLPTDFEIPPDQPAERKILFLTRVWDPRGRSLEIANQFVAHNEMRVNTIRAIKQHFGDIFIGGLERTPYAEEHYPDCIATHNTSKINYLSLIKKCLIAITTTGLYNSTGWKLPEYLAAARCIITEPLIHRIPSPLMEGNNIITFTNPEQCVNACGRILEDPHFAQQMRMNNFEYYNNQVKPSQLLLNRIGDVIRHDQYHRHQ